MITRMKRIILCALAAVLLCLCACSKRKAPAEEGTDLPAETPAQTTPASGGKTPTGTQPLPQGPASGTDLLIPEALSPEADASLSALRDAIDASDCVCALALLGHVSPELPLEESIVAFSLLEERDYALTYPFLAEITPSHCVNPAFSDLYCLVPRSSVRRVTVCQMEMDDDGEQTDRTEAVLYENTDGAPVFLSSQSNGWGGSNIRVLLRTEDGTETALVPAILANLGTLAPQDGVYDFSIYFDSPIADGE